MTVRQRHRTARHATRGGRHDARAATTPCVSPGRRVTRRSGVITPPSVFTCSMVIINMHMLLALLAPFVLTLQMHTNMGDERGIRLRCICLGDAALRGSRMSARGRCGKGSESRIARSSLSNARSSVCATSRCLRINITIVIFVISL